MFTKFNQVLLASVLTVGSVMLPVAVMAQEQLEQATSGDEVSGTMPVYRSVSWAAATNASALPLEFNEALTNEALGTVTYSNNGTNWKIAVYSDNGGLLEHATEADTIAYTVKLACTQGTSADYQTPTIATSSTTAVSLCSGNAVFADATADLTLNISADTGNTVKRAGDYSDNLYLVIRANE
jgi:hypothetical protein